MYTLEEDYETDMRPKTATKRAPAGGYRTGEQRQEAHQTIANMPTGNRRPRASHYNSDGTPRSDVQTSRLRRAGDVAENTASQPDRAQRPRPTITTQHARPTTTQRPAAPPTSKLKKQPSTRQKQTRQPAFYVGMTALTLVGGWFATTWGASAWTTNLSYPGQFGPMHGTVVEATIGGGDSKAHPSKIIGWNDNGQVEFIVLLADNPRHTQIIPGPNLKASNFPDPAGSEVQLETGDFNHDGHTDVRAHILSTEFDLPFYPHQQPVELDGDGKGNLKPVGGQ